MARLSSRPFFYFIVGNNQITLLKKRNPYKRYKRNLRRRKKLHFTYSFNKIRCKKLHKVNTFDE